MSGKSQRPLFAGGSKEAYAPTHSRIHAPTHLRTHARTHVRTQACTHARRHAYPFVTSSLTNTYVHTHTHHTHTEYNIEAKRCHQRLLSSSNHCSKFKVSTRSCSSTSIRTSHRDSLDALSLPPPLSLSPPLFPPSGSLCWVIKSHFFAWRGCPYSQQALSLPPSLSPPPPPFPSPSLPLPFSLTRVSLC